MKISTSGSRNCTLLISSFVLSAIANVTALAQEKPSATGGQGSSAKLSASEGKTERDNPQTIHKREEWFYRRRASVNGHIPTGARARALAHLDQMMMAEGKLVRRADGSIAEVASPLATAGPVTNLWTSIGPTPTTGGQFSPVTGRITTIAVDPSDITGNTVLIGGAQGGIWRSVDAGATWTAVGDQNPSLAMGSIAFAPSAPATVYAGTGEQASIGFDVYYGAGVLKSTDSGQTWTQTCKTAGPSCPFIGPFSDATPFGFFTLGGARISYVSVNPTNSQLVLVAAQTQFGEGSTEGVYCSADGGATWANVLPGEMATFVGFASPTVAFAALGNPSGSSTGINGIYKSINAGSCSMTFAAMGGGLPTATTIGRVDMGISPNFATDSTVYASISSAATASQTNLGVWATTDGGNTWTQKTTAPDVCQLQCWYDNVIKVDPTSGAHAFFGGSSVFTTSNTPGWVVRTADTGATWATIIPNATGPGLPHVDNHAIAFAKLAGGKIRMYLGNDGGIWRTDDAEAASVVWTPLNDSTLTLTQFYPAIAINASSPSIAFGGTQDNGSQNYQGPSTTWTDNGLCGDGGSAAVDAAVPSTVYIGCVTGSLINVSYQNAAANTFLTGVNGINPADSMDLIPPLTADPTTANVVYFGTTKIYQTVDGAANWVALSGDLVSPASDFLTAIAVAPKNGAVVYTGSFGGKVFVATNVAAGAGAFNAVAGQASLPPRAISAIATDPSDAMGKTAYVAESGFSFVASGINDPKGHIFKTTDGGATWADVSCTTLNCSTPALTDLPNTPVNDVVVDPNIAGTLYAATDVGVFQGTCTTTAPFTCTWATLSTGLPRVAALSLRLHAPSRTLFAATHGRGVWSIDLNNFTFPGPHLASLSPVSASAGNASSFPLTVTGNGLTGGTIHFGGTALATVGTPSDTQMMGTVPANLAAGATQVTVVVGANTSNGLTFAATSGVPTITSVAPTSTPVMTPRTITVTGTNFIANSKVIMNPDQNSTALTTTFVNNTTLMASVSAAFINGFGSTNSVGVQNPTPGGGTTSPVGSPTFVVVASVPTNDNFANAMTVPLNGSGTFADTKDSSAATTQTTDPNPPFPSCVSVAGEGLSNTIWYKFTPPSNGTITDVDTIGSNYDTVLSIWTGTVGSFTSVACNDDISTGVNLQSQISNLAVTAGTTYYIMVSSFGSADLNAIAFGGKSVLTLTFSGSASSNYSISASALSPSTVTAGSSGTSTITVTPAAGSTGTLNVNVTCSTLPPGVTCSPNPLPISATGTTPATGQLTVNVAAPSAQNATASVFPAEQNLYSAGMTPSYGASRKSWWMLSGGTGLAGIALLFFPGRKRYRAALGLGLICVVSFTLGCGGGYGGGGGGGPVATATHIMVTSVTKGPAGTTFNFTATVTGGTPTDMVQLMDNGVATGSAVAVSNGTAMLTTAALSIVGTHSITAHYAGDPTYTQASNSGALNVTITGNTTVTVQGAPAASNGSLAINMTIN